MYEKNTVKASAQVKKERYVEIVSNEGGINVLFVGNSITRHEPKPEIGWNNDWGMAASRKDNDYVHVAVKLLEEKIGKINYCVTNCGEWELNYFQDNIIDDWQKARGFNADIVIIRLGENIWNVKEKFFEFSLAKYFSKMIKYFAVKNNAKVIVTGLFWKNDLIEDAIKQVAKESGYTFVKLSDLGDSQSNMAIGQFWHEGVSIHPNDNGMRQIAERIVDGLTNNHKTED